MSGRWRRWIVLGLALVVVGIGLTTAAAAPSSLPANNRVQPTETTVFRVPARLTEDKLEADSDYHLVLVDGAGNSTMGEIPDPACVGSSSPLLAGIQQARSQFDANYTATGSSTRCSMCSSAPRAGRTPPP